MREPETFVYGLRELLTLMIRDRGLHDGHWAMRVEFGLGAGNAGPAGGDIYPTAFVPVKSVGVIRADTEGPLTVDAAQVNPAPAPAPRKRAARKTAT